MTKIQETEEVKPKRKYTKRATKRKKAKRVPKVKKKPIVKQEPKPKKVPKVKKLPEPFNPLSKSKIPKDYLKYYKVIFYFYKKKFDITQAELDAILFLFSEGYFDAEKVKQIEGVIPWNTNRIKSMIEKGLIDIFREDPNKKKIYQLSKKARNIVNGIYEKMNGDLIAATSENNKMFFKNVSYTDKVYRKMIKVMNESKKLPQHQLPEL